MLVKFGVRSVQKIKESYTNIMQSKEPQGSLLNALLTEQTL